MINLPSIFQVLTLLSLWVRGRGKTFTIHLPIPLQIATTAGNEHCRQLAVKHHLLVQREALEIAGSINQSASALSAALHVDSPLRPVLTRSPR